MNFNEACDKAFDIENDRLTKEGKPKLIFKPDTARQMCLIWNTIAIALREGSLDDLVYVDEKNNIVSNPFTDNSKKTGQKKSTPATAIKKDVVKSGNKRKTT